MGQNPLVSIIIPTYNRKQELTRLIESIKQSDYPKESMEIIVVDDASTDGTYGSIRKRFPEVKVIRNTKRRMTSGARNIGIKCSKGDYLFFIDHDNVIDRNAINELVNFMKRNRDVGLAGPVMYYYSVPKEIWCAGGKLRHPLYFTTWMYQHETSESPKIANSYAIECDYIPNAFMVRKQIIKEVGFFDEKNFPLLWEDADFSLKIRQRGYRIVAVPKAKVWHDVSTAKDFHITEERTFFRGRARARFYLKCAPLRTLMLPIDMLGFSVVLFECDRGSRRLRKLWQYLKGIVHGLVLATSANQYKEEQS
ncbi:MAG: glycosyltransferase family 2 protein [Candidatus Bathyarchaeota archaeon]|nr:glycosyltransferase family 2 protein [Candidatus Bathyarchaeota archaeon]